MENILTKAKAYQKKHPKTVWQQCIKAVSGKKVSSHKKVSGMATKKLAHKPRTKVVYKTKKTRSRSRSVGSTGGSIMGNSMPMFLLGVAGGIVVNRMAHNYVPHNLDPRIVSGAQAGLGVVMLMHKSRNSLITGLGLATTVIGVADSLQQFHIVSGVPEGYINTPIALNGIQDYINGDMRYLDQRIGDDYSSVESETFDTTDTPYLPLGFKG